MLSRCLHTQTEEDSPELSAFMCYFGVNTWTTLFLHQAEIKACLCSSVEEQDSLSGARRQLYNFFLKRYFRLVVETDNSLSSITKWTSLKLCSSTLSTFIYRFILKLLEAWGRVWKYRWNKPGKRLIACSIVFLVLWADVGKEKHCCVEQASNLEDVVPLLVLGQRPIDANH